VPIAAPRPAPVRPAPEPAEAEAAPVPPVAASGTVVVVTNGGLLADVYFDASRIGQTGRPIKLGQGTYPLRVQAPGFDPVDTTVTVSAGEKVTSQVTLRVTPRYLLLRGFADDCQVALNGAEAGTVAHLGSKVEVKRPDLATDLVVTCGGVPRPFHFDEGSLYIGNKNVNAP
jgi:hypothetical protein